MNYYQFHIADWALHTSHLSLEEEAVYRRLLDYYYDTEAPIPRETKWVIRRLRLLTYEDVVGLILDEFFVEKDGKWHNPRADKEIAEYQAKAETARSNGRKGGRPKKQSVQKQSVAPPENPEETKAVISGMQQRTGLKANHKPRTINQEPKEKKPSVSFSEDDFRLAEFMFDHIRQVVPDFKDRKLEPWANTIRLMRERDSVTHRRIAEVFLWANRDSFWKTNILSPDKLREKFPQLAAKREENNNAGNQRAVGQSRSDRNDQALREYFAQIDAEEDSGGDLDGTFQPEIGDRPGGQLGAPAI